MDHVACFGVFAAIGGHEDAFRVFVNDESAHDGTPSAVMAQTLEIIFFVLGSFIYLLS